jgi:hypothetical protein
MVVDDRAAIVQRLTDAERKSPPVYDPARELFYRVLQGDLSLEKAIIQARNLHDQTERKCATEILRGSETFLLRERRSRIGPFPTMTYRLPNGMGLNVSGVMIRHLNPERLMVLHLWKTPLSDWQLSAASAVLKSVLLDQQPQYSACELDFISVSNSNPALERRFKQYNWTKLKPLNEHELARFWRQLLAAWSEYQRRPPREIRRKHLPSLLDFARKKV